MSKKADKKKPPRASTPERVSAGFEDAVRTTPMGIEPEKKAPKAADVTTEEK